MQKPPTSDRLVQYSFDELRAIVKWLEENTKAASDRPRAILVGGWAVYAYNPYYGSYDIDLVTNSDTRSSLMHFLKARRGFEKYKSPSTGEIGVIQITPIGKPIHIDFSSLSGFDTFEGTGGRIQMYDLVSSARIVKTGDWLVPLPARSSLLIMKSKAAWDRQYRLDKGSSRDPQRDEEKLVGR